MTAAVVSIDMQNGFIHPDGSLLRSGRSLYERESVVREAAALLAEARRRAIPVLHTAHEHRPDYLDAPPFVKELFCPVDGLVAGTWDAAFLAELAPLPGEPVIRKNRYDAFLYTDLEVMLRALGVSSVLFCGVATHACVESSARAADMRDFRAAVASDACTAMPEFHAGALNGMTGVGIAVAPWREALAAIAPLATVA